MADVVRSFTRGKYDDPARNEDACVVTGAFFAVIDGATAKRALEGGESPGRCATQAVAAAIERLPPMTDAAGAVNRLSAAVAGLTGPQGAECPSASVTMFSAHRREVWAVGDGWMMADGSPRRFSHEIEHRGAAARAALLRIELLHTSVDDLRRHDVGREMISPLLEREHMLANVDSSDPLVFGRLDGRPVPCRLIRVLPVPASCRKLVLASDGYPALATDFAASEGLLAERLRTDPLMISDPPATKGVGPGQVSYDDRTWLEIAL